MTTPTPGRPEAEKALPVHPEPHSHTWTDMEKRCILQWGQSLLASKDAEIERLRADAGRVERNRDMWRGQCERQAERLTKLHISISDHNKDCARQCNQRKEMGAAHCPMKGYDRDCGDCPRDGMLTLANDGSAIEPWMEQEAKYEVEMRALAGDAALSAKAIGGEHV